MIGLLDFLDASPVNFYAVKTVCSELDKAGFKRLDSADSWEIVPGSRYYVTKNDSAVFAFIAGTSPVAGYKIIAAHSDSPCFRIKPNAAMPVSAGILRLNTEVYGGPILSTWFDRPLSIAGRVIIRSKNALHPERRLVRFEQPLLTIPNLAIHFNRQVNDGYKISPQKDMIPVLAIMGSEENPAEVLPKLVAEKLGIAVEDILDFDLSLYDTTPACTFGVHNEFISAGRIDDLSMVHAALAAMVATADQSSEMSRVMAIFDNEETGSGTKQGAHSPILADILLRINAAFGGNQEEYIRAVENSFMVSADNAHGFHPNYGEKYDPTNHPRLGGGPVIKVNARCKYMTDADSAAVFRNICEIAGVPCQYFVNHSDVAGGSTLGNILTAQIPLRGVDMGAPVWAMHSVRETASMADHEATIAAFSTFYAL